MFATWPRLKHVHAVICVGHRPFDWLINISRPNDSFCNIQPTPIMIMLSSACAGASTVIAFKAAMVMFLPPKAILFAQVKRGRLLKSYNYGSRLPPICDLDSMMSCLAKRMKLSRLRRSNWECVWEFEDSCKEGTGTYSHRAEGV